MNTKILLLFFTLLCVSLRNGYTQTQHIVLTGNTADISQQQDLFLAISKYCDTQPEDVTWVLNGDLFPKSFNVDSISNWQQKIFILLDKYPRLTIVVAQGDGDWKQSEKQGWEHLLSIEKTLSKTKHSRFTLLFGHGCPGPYTLTVGKSLTIVAFNSQWWNHPYEKPTPYSATCTIADTDNFIEELEGILDDNATSNVLLLSHFPLQSMGEYGGRFPASRYLLPPVIGSAVAGFHQNIGATKDINNANYSPFSYRMQGTLHDYASLIVVSGHERNHSVLPVGGNFFINSGAPEKGSHVARHPDAKFRTSAAGFMELIYYEDGRIDYQFLNDQLKGQQTGTLLQSSCLRESENRNTRIIACSDNKQKEAKSTPIENSVTTAIAGNEYESSGFKEFWLGRHYRRSWTATVNVPVLNMDTTFHGLIVTAKGGGRQTTSIKLNAGNGKEYVFRSVDKDPSRALDFQLRNTIVSELLKDQTTTQQPYGALAVAPLMDKLKILHASPSLYVLPDHPRMAMFQDKYKHLFGMLEERPNDKIEKDKVFGGADHIEKSFKLFAKMHRSHNTRVDDHEFAKARLFDLWVGDWSKHEDNWKWAGYQTKQGEVFRPIPRDRDHAFSRWDGIIPWIADREWGMPNGENFGFKINGLKSLMFQARYLDRFVGNQVSKEQWIAAAKEIQSAITSVDISEAVHSMPEEIYQVDGKLIEEKLIARLKDLPYYAEQYYYLLATHVDIAGSNKKESFHVTRKSDGSVKVEMFDIEHDEVDSSQLLYQRTFFPNETKEIRLYGLSGNDRFIIKGKATQSILVRVVNDHGDNVITDESSVTGRSRYTLIYEKNIDSKINIGTEGKRVVPKDEQFYSYNRRGFTYNKYMPLALLSYNPFTGVALQGGVTFTRQHYGKPQFSAIHTIRGSVSTEGNYGLNYNNRLRHLVGKWDGISEVEFSRPLNFNYFFGVGNNTTKDKDFPKNYYRTQYNLALISAGLMRSFWKRSTLSFTANYEFDEGVKRSNSYLNDNPIPLATERLHILTVKGKLDLDFRDRASLPEHGFRFVVQQSGGHISNPADDFISITEAEIENYFSTYHKNPLTLGLRAGAGTTHGDLPFYKLLSLGQLDNLNGFKRNRFTGQSRAYINSELRWQLARVSSTLIPFKLGIRGFFDTGRVWADTDTSVADYWHYGYGGGLYLTPFREQFAINVSAGSSKEESLLLQFSIGAFFR